MTYDITHNLVICKITKDLMHLTIYLAYFE